MESAHVKPKLQFYALPCENYKWFIKKGNHISLFKTRKLWVQKKLVGLASILGLGHATGVSCLKTMREWLMWINPHTIIYFSSALSTVLGRAPQKQTMNQDLEQGLHLGDGLRKYL